MGISIEYRAARLVAALERVGKRVSSVRIDGSTIEVSFEGHDALKVDLFDQVDFKATSPKKQKKL